MAPASQKLIGYVCIIYSYKLCEKYIRMTTPLDNTDYVMVREAMDIISELNGKSIKKVTDLKESIKESFTHMTIQRGKNKIEIKASKKN